MPTVTRKMVVLPDAKPIFPKGGIYGPINTPYMEYVSMIGTLLMRGYRVTEVLNTGKRLPLNLSNFDQDNNVAQGPTQEELDRQAAEEAAKQAAEQERLAAEEKARLEAEKAAQEAAQQEAQQEASTMKVQSQQQPQGNKNKNKQQQQADKVTQK